MLSFLIFAISSPLVISLVFAHVLLILIVIKIIYRYFLDTWVEGSKIRQLMQIVVVLIIFIVFFYVSLILFQIL